ncbi:putative general secretion pathway protein L [Cystobacter fuscus DSM 2262]|uniref:General secretion pathway protein L n=1 Tax=Cystobacter fuscus (strain ATCC 25194 / DSM 2262 / NBRC 100088 / M29) TaxID=1242864 RepID=S9P2A4_CYSF2|nr:pilus assembly protein PilM [Cystobacter fuscus]EPX58575.1 putative general secretion pathway protein L [Cystobacter fuscus DSM 2262]
MARILGLDLGSHAVKGLLLDTSTRGAAAVKAFVEVRRAAEGDRQETLRQALRALLEHQELSNPDQVVVALPGPTLATHQLSLPFTDPKRIEATIPFEVESQIPFDLGEAIYDYQIATQVKDKGSELLVGVVRREELATLMGLLNEVGVDPRVVTHPGITYQNMLLQQGVDEETVAIVDIGHERTTLAIGRPGMGVEFARTFSGGGLNLSRALAAEFQTPLQEAHHWKETHGALASAAQAQGPDGERAAAAFVRGLQPVLRELRPSFKSFTARTRRQVTAVLVCGGTARIPGIAEQLTRDLGIPAKVVTLPQEVASAVPPGAQPLAAQAYSLALRGQASGAKAPRFNLRRGEFAFKGDYDYLKDKMGLLASFAVTLLLLLIASGVVRNSVLARREAQVDKVLCDVTQRILGSCEKNYDIALNRLKGVESPAAALPKLSAVNLLAELTQRVPADVAVTFDRIDIDLERISVRGVTDSSKQIDTIAAALRGHRCFKEVKEGKVEKTREGNKVSFRLDIQVQCAEQLQASEG